MKNFLQIFTLFSFILVIITTYLLINKIWVRKHEQEVADSISVSANILSNLQFMIALIVSLLSLDYINGISYIIWLVAGFIYILIGMGFWVQDGLSLMQKFKRSINLEKNESTAIIKDLLHLTNIEKIIELLCIVAIVDNDLDPTEEKLLRMFCKESNLNYDLTMKKVMDKFNNDNFNEAAILTELKIQVENYIRTSPRKQAVELMQNLIIKLINADGKVTPEEAMISSEIEGITNQYLQDEINPEKYNLIIIPQDQDTITILKSNNKIKKINKRIHGSKEAFLIDSFYSYEMANVVRDEYVKVFDCYTTIEKF